MKKILKNNFFLIALSVLIFCYLISYISIDVVLNDKIYQKYLDEKYEEKYSEYKDLDVDLTEFEDELKKFDQTTEDKIYGWDELYIDSLFVVIPFLLVSLCFSTTFLILLLFHKKFHIVKYIDILKVSSIAFMVFYLSEITSAIYFLIFKKSYELEEIRTFEGYFKFSKLFEKNNTPEWIWVIASQTGFAYLLFPLLAGLLLSIIYKDFKKWKLVGYSYLAYLIIFVFYNTVFWYLFDLV